MKKPELITIHGVKENLSVLYSNNNCNVIKIYDTVEESQTAEELVANLNRLKLLNKFSLDRDKPGYVRLVTTDYLENMHYLIAQK